ncbi:MAG: Asp-tRNA(Asn)/Glu-tRNA(Gln) amidotransferase subunit GatA [Chitinophagaceae bacterium]|jgi:aspartyl-tRNA(Asn)/glutamyl-tRNA(Gln) amidotransferase subunit A|nr:Asp-tRNA(Asn)/Glu-tRNA(Gln) amidotransferase subunit GatA [Chitinophagaceae bacterium]
MSFNYIDIATYHRQLQAGETTCVLATKHYLEQIEAHRHLNAFTEVWAQASLERAAQLDAQIDKAPLLPLHGVVVAIKDVLNYSGHEVTAGSAMLKGYKALYTATAVQKLLDAGAIIIGNCNCDEFAMGSSNENSWYGPVKNAADPTKVPGGSSGGSAVAVQAGMCMVSLGSDTGGSVRQPADFCGVTGLKPTYGSISRYGLIAYASSFDCVGIFGRQTADVARVFETISGHDELDATSLPGKPEGLEDIYAVPMPGQLKFAYLDSTLSLPGLDNEIKAAHFSLFEKLKAQGHIVEAVPFDLLDYVVPAYYVLTTAEASSNLSRYDGVRYGHQSNQHFENLTEFYKRNRSEGFGTEVKRRILLGSFVLSAGFYEAYFTKAQQVRQLLVQQTALVFNQYDAIIMPVSPTTAFALGEKQSDPVAMYLADIFTVFANLTGIPGLALPLFRHSNGMPFGTQVMANRGKELLLHQIGIMFEQMHKH